MLYGLLTFLLRLKKIKRKDPLGYDDPVGPVLLVIVLCGAVGTYLLRMYTFKWPGEEVRTDRSHRSHRSHRSPTRSGPLAL